MRVRISVMMIRIPMLIATRLRALIVCDLVRLCIQVPGQNQDGLTLIACGPSNGGERFSGPKRGATMHVVFWDERTLELRWLCVMEKWMDGWEM